MIHQTAFVLLALAGAALSNPTKPTLTKTHIDKKDFFLPHHPTRQNQDFGGTGQNGLEGGGCADNIIVFARGTTEPGNVGLIAGPPFFEATAEQVGEENLAVQGVDYPADIAGFLAGGDAGGSQTMADLVTQAINDCPNSNVIMSGYSQGAQLVHNAAELMGADVAGQVAGVVMFGDPNNGDPVAGIDAAQVKTFCNAGDNICDGGNLVLPPHLAYGADAGEAAAFAAGL